MRDIFPRTADQETVHRFLMGAKDYDDGHSYSEMTISKTGCLLFHSDVVAIYDGEGGITFLRDPGRASYTMHYLNRLMVHMGGVLGLDVPAILALQAAQNGHKEVSLCGPMTVAAYRASQAPKPKPAKRTRTKSVPTPTPTPAPT